MTLTVSDLANAIMAGIPKPRQDGWLTIDELSKETGVKREALLRLVDGMILAKRVERDRAIVERSDGRKSEGYVYRLTGGSKPCTSQTTTKRKRSKRG